MDTMLVAYNSKILRCVLVVCDMAVLVFAILFIWIFRADVWINVVLALAFVGVTIITVRFLLDRSPIAFECDEENLTLYRNKTKTVIPLSEIIRVSINEMDNLGGSFDAAVYTINKRYAMHMLIKNRYDIYERFIKILEDRNIEISLREVPAGGD